MLKIDNMKWSPILHGISAIAGIIGFLSLVGAWLADGNFPNFSQQHLFNVAIGLLLTSIAFGIGTIIHQNEERKLNVR